jgi:hypothetical protein
MRKVCPNEVPNYNGSDWRLGISVRYANEETAEREVVYGVEVTVCGRTGVFEAVIEPAKRYGLLGAIVLEALDLIADPRSQRLYVNPRSPDLPMAEIE